MAFWEDEDEEFHMPKIQLEQIDWVKSALFNAMHSGLTLEDVCEASRHAESAEAFDEAISFLIA